ncbi:hypothetical protein BDV98DRAFT_176687 [Pterulicium gracile]|uniref:F-box domain-containing protein n=1 Tax=Pterulicium gracile TaxID=1884261 RepID=A0A5C3QGM0_9AGAR|nr:hypothetical protein BDV98DRAFT_176687 [Pterula gracilis]
MICAFQLKSSSQSYGSTYFGCGIPVASAEAACTIVPPSILKQCDYAPSTLQSARDTVEVDEAKLADLDRAIEHLRKHRQGLHAAVIQFKARLASVAYVPDDALLLIFGALRDDMNTGHDEPWIIAATCRRWRALVFSCSSFWSNIELGFWTHESKSVRKSEPIPRLLLRCWCADAQLKTSNYYTSLSCVLDLSNDFPARFPQFRNSYVKLTKAVA